MIRVLVVDDSLFMRKLISRLLSSDAEIEVIDAVKNGREALEKVFSLMPDVVTLDLAMSAGIDEGLDVLKQIMAKCPTPVVIISAHSREEAAAAFGSFELGAVSYVLKPSGELSLDIDCIKANIIKEVKAASRVNMGKVNSLRPLVLPRIAKRKKPSVGQVVKSDKIIVIGASTGGPQALEVILSGLPVDFSSPLIIVQHAPAPFFNDAFAERLNNISRLPVVVAEDNAVIQGGVVYMLPPWFNLGISRHSLGNWGGFRFSVFAGKKIHWNGLHIFGLMQ